MKKKRRRVKWKNVARLVLVIILIVFIIKILKGCSSSPFSVKLKIKSIEYGTVFDPSMIEKVTYKGKNIKDEIKFEFDSKKLGANDLILIYNNEKYKYKLNVVDTKKPNI